MYAIIIEVPGTVTKTFYVSSFSLFSGSLFYDENFENAYKFDSYKFAEHVIQMTYIPMAFERRSGGAPYGYDIFITNVKFLPENYLL